MDTSYSSFIFSPIVKHQLILKLFMNSISTLILQANAFIVKIIIEQVHRERQ